MQVNQNIDETLYQEYRRNGYSDIEIKNAWNDSQGNITKFKHFLQDMKNQQILINHSYQQYNDDDIQIAMVASLKMHQQQVTSVNFRDDTIPCGLLNVGNTCYFNSLLQIYYFIYNFVSPIVSCKFDEINNIDDQKIVNSINLLKNLQNIFVLMIGSDRQFINPKQVILSICDDFGNSIPIGDQKDVCEFNHYFLSRIDEGLTYLTQQQQKTNNSQSQQFIKQPLSYQSRIQFPNMFQQNQSFIAQKSLLMKQSSKIYENSIIYKLFYGKFTPQILIQGIPNRDSQQELFNIIQIDVNHKTLIESIDKYMNQAIEYKNDNNEYQQAIKQFWISQAPQVFTFQIQRVEFNKEFGSFSKINYPFYFEKELFIDPYLLSNQKLARDIQTQNQQLKDKLNQIDKDLEQLQQFNGNVEIIKNLEITLQFLKVQTSYDKNNPFYVEFNENKSVIKSISDYHQYFIQKRDNLLKEKKYIELTISKSYNQLKKHKYILQSILMHEGSHDAGHYFAYIYNFDDQKWYYFSDIHVHEETEQNVLKFAYGDQINSKSAYLIQYIQEDKLKLGQKKIKTFSNSQNTNYLMDQYGLLLSQKQRDFLYQDNQKLNQEFQQQVLTNQIQTIIQIYNQYLDFGNEKQRKYQMKTNLSSISQKPPYFSNYAMFLKTKPDERMFKWIILDLAIKKVMTQFNGLFGQPEINEQIKNQILDEINKVEYYKLQYFPSIQERQASKEEYKQNIKLQIMIAYILEQYNNNKLIETLKSLHKFIKLAKLTNQQSYFYNIAIQLKLYTQLGVVCTIWQNKIINDQEIQVLKLLIAFQLQEHFQYKEPKLWCMQLSKLIGFNEKLNQEVLKPLIQNKKDIEMCHILDSSSKDFDQYIEQLQKQYIEKGFENDVEDFLSETLMSNLQKLFQIRSIQQLIEIIEKSTSILDKKEILKIFEEYPQIK